MNQISLSALGNHLWQSTAVAALAGLLTLMLRKYGAHVRYWVWFTASVKFLVPFSILITLGSAVRWPFTQPIAALPSIVEVATEIAQPFVTATPSAVRPSPVGTIHVQVPTILFITWLVGFMIIVALWVRSWWRMRATIRGASPVVIRPNIHAMASPALLEPSVFGIFRPVLLLPHDIQERLSEEQLHSVLAHEMCHIRRRDNLLSSLHMTVAAIFWFYPVVWWLGSRLLEERERACDEAVVREGSDPHSYAEGILSVCRLYLESPLRCAAGVGGPNLQRRIEAIVGGSVAQELNIRRLLVLAIAAIFPVAAPIAVGMLNASSPLQAISRPADTPKWEAVAVKACRTDLGPDARGGGGTGFTPGRLNLECQTAGGLIQAAYINGRGQGAVYHTSIEGGPSWINSERYTVTAKAEGTPSRDIMSGPMSQTILEERFKLRVHWNPKEVPIYELTVAKGGPKLQPFKESSCIPPVFPPAPPPTGQRYCTGGFESSNQSLPLGLIRMHWEGMTIEGFTGYLNGPFAGLDRQVFDKTGLAGKFDIRIEHARKSNQQNAPPEGTDPAGPSIFTALQEQLGLKLESANGTGYTLVIDSIERPTEN